MAENVKKAIVQIKNGKSPGPDNLHSEFLKLLNMEGIIWLTRVFNNIYSAGKLLTQWLKSIFIALPKNPSAKHFNNFHTNSIMSHLLKIFLRIIHQKMYKKCVNQMSSTQFSFKNSVSTR
jgi:hypothetical protein|uniref:RNA-directed DNA polymerase n=1 Tax=Sipha flava TaxID=143950 RepID=A0A2S2QDY4_9HEMI